MLSAEAKGLVLWSYPALHGGSSWYSEVTRAGRRGVRGAGRPARTRNSGRSKSFHRQREQKEKKHARTDKQS